MGFRVPLGGPLGRGLSKGLGVFWGVFKAFKGFRDFSRGFKGF